MRDDVTFVSDGRKLAGHLYLPEDRPAAGKRPAVVVVGASSGTKEQTPAVYSRRLVALGYAALAMAYSSAGQQAKAEEAEQATRF